MDLSYKIQSNNKLYCKNYFSIIIFFGINSVSFFQLFFFWQGRDRRVEKDIIVILIIITCIIVTHLFTVFKILLHRTKCSLKNKIKIFQENGVQKKLYQ